MTKLIIILLAVEFLVAYFVVSSGYISRHDQVHAYVAWRDHPTPETRAELDRQKRITEFQTLVISAIIFCGMAGVTLFAAHAWRQKHKHLTDDKSGA